METASSATQQPPGGDGEQTPPVSSHSTDPLRELTASPGADPNPQSTLTAGTEMQIHHSLTTLRESDETHAHK